MSDNTIDHDTQAELDKLEERVAKLEGGSNDNPPDETVEVPEEDTDEVVTPEEY